MNVQSIVSEAVVGNDNDEPEMNDETETEGQDDTSGDAPPPDLPAPPAPSEEDTRQALRLLEAMLFATSEIISERALSHRIPEGMSIKALLNTLQAEYADRGVNLLKTGNSWGFRTAPDITNKLNVEADVTRKMGRATIETMSIIAYHQPVTRAEIEEIRGVSLSKGTFDLLFDKDWIKPRGRRETPGRPMTWGTTDEFLDHFGLSRVSDLPGMDELKAAGLLESGPALNVYHNRGTSEEEESAQGELLETAASENEDNQENEENGVDMDSLAPFSSQGEEDSLPEIENDQEIPEPLDPDENL